MNAIKGGVNMGGASVNTDLLIKIEEAAKRRLDVGARMSYAKLVEDLGNSGQYSGMAITTTINILVQKEEFQMVQEGKVIIRKK
jgi:hypothetical protein